MLSGIRHFLLLKKGAERRSEKWKVDFPMNAAVSAVHHQRVQTAWSQRIHALGVPTPAQVLSVGVGMANA